MEKLNYINDEAEIISTRYGFVFIPNIAEKYRGESARGKAVIAIRDTNCLRDVFSVDSMDYFLINQILYTLSSPGTPPKTISEVLTILYQQDAVFHQYLANLYYARFVIKDQENSDTILDFIMNDVNLRISMSKSKMNTCISGLSHMYTNGIEYYYSVADKAESRVKIPIEYDYEVLTNAKNWDSSIQR